MNTVQPPPADRCPTQPAPSLEQSADALATRCEKLAQRARFAELLPSHERPRYSELAVAIAELSTVVRELTKRSLPR